MPGSSGTNPGNNDRSDFYQGDGGGDMTNQQRGYGNNNGKNDGEKNGDPWGQVRNILRSAKNSPSETIWWWR